MVGLCSRRRKLCTLGTAPGSGQEIWFQGAKSKLLTRVAIATVERIRNYADVYTLTTDHPTHNFLVAGLICQNKPPRTHPDKGQASASAVGNRDKKGHMGF